MGERVVLLIHPTSHICLYKAMQIGKTGVRCVSDIIQYTHVKLQIPLNLGDIQPKGVQVTIRGRGELLLATANGSGGGGSPGTCRSCAHCASSWHRSTPC